MAWHPASWRERSVLQQPHYPDPEAHSGVLKRLQALPPLVTSWEVRRLKAELAEAAHGKRFLLQGGDCAESFDECRAEVITTRLKILLQMSVVLLYGLRMPVVRVGRFAGQYAKPRSSNEETRDGVTLPSYRGDIINGLDFTEAARVPDPERMLEAYSRSALTLNFIRGLTEGGFADLHHPEYWDLDFVSHSPLAAEYEVIVSDIVGALTFMETILNATVSQVERVEFFTSHEALLLPFEEALTRRVPHTEGFYNLGAHFPWIGVRTADIEGAHIEYARGIANPIGLKVGPSTTPDTLRRLVDTLDPEGEPGRLTLITRFGANAIGDHLPALIKAVQRTGKTILWCSDPMHGNTEVTESGIKTRRFENILDELEQAFDIHAAEGSLLGGVHFELTGEAVTECMGGARGLSEDDLAHAYKSQVDPRLNGEQALEMAFCLTRKFKRMALV